MGFLWLFHKSLKKATEFNISLHILMPSGFDETIECKPQKTKVMKQVEKPLNFDPFGHARFAHLFVLYDWPFKVLVLGGNIILPF